MTELSLPKLAPLILRVPLLPGFALLGVSPRMVGAPERSPYPKKRLESVSPPTETVMVVEPLVGQNGT